MPLLSKFRTVCIFFEHIFIMDLIKPSYRFTILLGFSVLVLQRLNVVKGARFKRLAATIDPIHLIDILISENTPYGNVDNKTESLFQEYSQFLVHFNFTQDRDTSLEQMNNLLNSTHKYNQERLNVSTSFIQLWISLIPGINITEDIEATLDLIKKVNFKQRDTVLAFLLHYPSMILNNKTVTLIRFEINIAKSLVQNNIWLSVGLILDVRNCPGSASHFGNLKYDLNAIDLIIFMVYDNSTKQLISESYQYLLCNDELSRNTNIVHQYRSVGFYVNSPIEIKAKKNLATFTQNRAALVKFLNITATLSRHWWFHFIVEIEGIFEHNLRSTTFHNNSTNQVEFFGDDSQIFNPNYFGVALSNLNTLLLPHTLSNFNKFILQPRLTDVSNVKDESFQRFVIKFTAYNRMQCRGKNVFSYDASNNLATDSNSEEVFIVLYDNIISTIEVGNSTFPGVITGILINYDDYTNQDTSRKLSVENTTESTETNEQKNTTLEIMVWAKTKDLNVGAIIDLGNCIRLHKEIWDFSTLKMFIVKVNLSVSNPYLYNTSEELISLLNLCYSRLSGDYFIHSKTNVGLKVAFYIKVYACSNKNSEIIPFVRFWEAMHNWAKMERTTVFMDTAYEDTSLYLNNYSKCFNDRYRMNSENCDCGWWKVFQKTTSSIASYVVEDKKSIETRLKIESKRRLYEKEQNNYRITLVYILVPLSTLILIFIICAFFLVYRYRTKYLLSKKDVQDFFKGSGQSSETANGIQMDTSGKAQSQPYDKERFEVDKKSFTIDTERCLGSGEFGTVYAGFIIRNNVQINVAVKTLTKRAIGNSHGECMALKGLIGEIKILSYVGTHKHIINLEGAHTTDLRKGKLFVFLEICELGSLEKYFRKLKEQEVDNGGNSRANSNDDINSLNSRDYELNKKDTCESLLLDVNLRSELSRWSGEIACGMEYLTSKNLVHADLAARNILLNSPDKIVKISDFGLSRRLYDYENYIKRQQEPLPWRWMAPESLRKMVFNEKTDVWAFGILLWEIYTLGDQPYPGLAWDINFTSMLERGLRLQEPTYNECNIYVLMKRCWDREPDQRPTFAELKSILYFES